MLYSLQGGNSTICWPHKGLHQRMCPGGVRSHLPALPLVPACHQDPSCQLLPVTVAARSEQIGCRLHQWGLVQLDAVGGAKDTGEYWPHLS